MNILFRTIYEKQFFNKKKRTRILTSIMVIFKSFNIWGLTYEFEQFNVNLEAISFCVKLSKHRFINS